MFTLSLSGARVHAVHSLAKLVIPKLGTRYLRNLIILSLFFSTPGLATTSASSKEAAIAYCADDDNWGIGIGKTADAANDLAVQHCESKSSSGCCEVEITTGDDRCIALAIAKKVFASGSGNTRSAAKGGALTACNDNDCYVVAAPCAND